MRRRGRHTPGVKMGESVMLLKVVIVEDEETVSYTHLTLPTKLEV